MLSISPRATGGGGAPHEHAAAQTPDAPGGTPAPAAPAAAAPEENRTSPRRPASSVPTITGLRFKPHGVEAVLVNISASGLLAECSERLKPGSSVTAVFEGSFAPGTIDGRVARTVVSSMGKDGRLRYHVGIAFAKPCPLEPDAPAAAAPAPAASAPAAPAPAASTPATATAAAPAPAAPAAAAAKPAVAPVVPGPAPATTAAAPPVVPSPAPAVAAAAVPVKPAVAAVAVRNRW